MNSYRRGLRNGALVNPKLFILEKVNLGPHTKCWSNLVKRVKTRVIWYGSLHARQAHTRARPSAGRARLEARQCGVVTHFLVSRLGSAGMGSRHTS